TSPARLVTDPVDLEAHVRVGAHGADLEAVAGVRVDTLSVVLVGDGDDVRATFGVAADTTDFFGSEQIFDFRRGELADHRSFSPLGSRLTPRPCAQPAARPRRRVTSCG